MMNRLKSRGLIKNDSDEQQAEPMAGLSNMSDTMLVLAVGIMLALVMAYKVDLKSVFSQTVNGVSSVVDAAQLTEIESYESISEDEISNYQTQEGLEEKGKVFIDPNTKKVYILVEK